MANIIRLSNSDFIQKVMMLDGDPWRFVDRPYIFPIVNSKFKRTLLLASRQVEKSTTLAGINLAKACLNKNKNFLYVAPTMKQTGVFSRKKIDEVFETSPLLKKAFYPGHKGFRVEEKRLKNYATMYFRSAYHDADSIRGITSDGTSFDEIQDMLPEVIPVIEACSQKKLDAQFFYAGTPKTYDNTIHLKWEQSTQCEWHVKCFHCGHYNNLGVDNVLLDKPGIWCSKCQGDIDPLYGCWVEAKESDMAGFRLPYLIIPKRYLDFKELFWKMRNYDTASLMNEVFGVSYDNGKKPITREQLIEACDKDRHMWNELPQSFRSTTMYAGIDWGGGQHSYTILTIGYPDVARNAFCIVYNKKFVGAEADPENLLHSLASLIVRFNAKVIGADFGFGFGLNDRLRKMLSHEYVYATFRHAYIKKYVAYDQAGETYVTNRTETMTDLFNGLKSGRVRPYCWNEFEEFGRDYLNINSEYSETLRQLRYVHTQPDDAFHSTLYAYLSWVLATNQQVSTRYDAGSDEPDVHENTVLR